MNTNTGIYSAAYRDMRYEDEILSNLRQILESTSFHCKVLVYPQRSLGLLRVEYEGDSEKEVQECDKKLTAKMIICSEAKGSRGLFLLPLELLKNASQ